MGESLSFSVSALSFVESSFSSSSLPPSPLPKLLHPLAVRDAEVLHLIKQRRGRRKEEREGRQGHCKTRNVERRNERTALVGRTGKCWEKQKTWDCITICSTCALPVDFSSVGSVWRLQLQYCRHQKAALPLFFKLHCGLFVCYRECEGREEMRQQGGERQTTWVWKQWWLKPARDLGTWKRFINHSEVMLAGREEKAEERQDQKRWSPEERDIAPLACQCVFQGSE